MNVKNSPCIRRLAIKTLKKSAKRNIIAVAAIVLTTLLITSIFSVAFSFITASRALDDRIAGCAADLYFDNISDEQADEILSYGNVRESAWQLRVGSYDSEPFSNKPLEICYLDSQDAVWHFAEPVEGRLPENANEIAVDAGVLKALNLPEETGTIISIPYVEYGNADACPTVAEFELVGIFAENSIASCHYVLVSEEFAESVNSIRRLDITVKGNLFAFEETLFDETGVRFGEYKIKQEAFFDGGSLFILAIFLLVIGMSGYLIIYNIFQISVVNDISYYGLLKTIGVTGKQLKRIIRIQSLILSAIGIPIGLILGYIVGKLTSPTIFLSTILAPVADSFSVSPWIFITSCIFALITVFVSCSKPGRIASKISPVEAFRYSEVKTDNKNNKKVSGLFGMAVRNLARNKKKTILVFFSMALPIVILCLGISLSKGVSFVNYYHSDFAFKVSNSDFFNFEIPTVYGDTPADFISDIDIENINADMNFANWGSAYTTAGIPRVGEDKLAVVSAYDENLFDYVEVIDGDIAPLFDPDSNAIAVTLDSNLGEEVHVGDRITVDYGYVNFIDTRTGEVIEDQALIDSIPYELIEPEPVENTKEYEICAVVSYSSDLFIGYIFGDSYSLVLPVSKLQADTNGRMYRYLTVFDAPESGDIEATDEYIRDYCERSGLQYKSEATERMELQAFENAIRSITISICVVLLIIGILNFVNAVLTGILTRSHEFAVLKAIGMTDRQQKRILITEGICYVAGSILLGTIIYSILHFPFTVLFAESGFIDPQYSVAPIAVIALVFAIFGVLIPYVVYSVTAAKTVVERLRVNE